jgi:hypothetical protein
MKKYAIISLHNGKASELFQTCKSIDTQVENVDLHLIISKTSFYCENLIKRKYRKIILCKDKSIYHAMNLALKSTNNYYITFLNSGDILENNFVVNLLKKKIKSCYKKSCLQFKTVLNFKNQFFYPQNKYFNSGAYKIHPSFIRPSLESTKSNILFDQKNYFYSDIKWMDKNVNVFGLKKINKYFAIHKLGGVSTNPTIYTVYYYSKHSKYLALKEVLKLIIKYTFFNKYFKIIYKNKFLLKLKQ